MKRALLACALVVSGALAAACGPDDSGSPTGTNGGGGTAGAGGDGAAGEGGSGGSGGAGGAGGEGGGAGGDCDTLSTAYCLKAQECTPFAIDLLYGSFDICVARLSLSCEIEEVAPGSTYDAAKQKACTEAATAASCDEFFANEVVACHTPPGTLPKGAACGSSKQCESRYCDLTNLDCGVCATPVPAGGSCADDNRSCEPGLSCTSGANKLCVARGKMGENCDVETQPCTPNLGCNGATCAMGAQAGEPCGPTVECDAANGIFCNMSTNLCQKVFVADVGEPCGVVMGKYTICNGASLCGPAKTCVARAGDGEPCDEAMGVSCFGPAFCFNGVCTLPDPAGCK